jgi:outer membrane protein TolC
MFRSLPFALLLLPAAALAQPAPKPAPADDLAAFDKDLDALFVGGGLTANQAAGRAAHVSPTVMRRAAEVRAAVAEAEQAELGQVPVVRASASYTRLSHIPSLSFTIVPGASPFQISFFDDSEDFQISTVVPLSDYVVRFPTLIKAARLGTETARLSKRSSEVNAGQDARLAYWEWVRAQLQVLISRRQLVQVQTTLKQVRALAEVQRLSRADLLRVESQEAEAEQVLDQLGYLAQLREEQLRILIGARPDEPLTIGEDIRADVAPPGAQPLDQLVGHALGRRLDVRTLDVGILAKEKQAITERANGYPKLSAFGTVDDARPNQRFFPLTYQFKTTWLVGVQLTWQLGDTLNAEMNRKRVIAETDELRADRENVVRGARIELLAAQQAVLLAQRALATSMKGLAAAEESYRVRQELLNAQRATAVELVDSQTDLTRARITALNARVDLRVALTQLEHALGDDATR